MTNQSNRGERPILNKVVPKVSGSQEAKRLENMVATVATTTAIEQEESEESSDEDDSSSKSEANAAKK